MNGPLDDTSAATAVVTTDTSPKSSPRRPPPIKPDIPCYVPSTKDELFKTTEKICQRILTHRQNLSLSKHEFQDLVLECTGSGAGSSPEAGNGSSYSTFLRFVTDLVEQLMADMFSTGASKQEPSNPPLMQHKTRIVGGNGSSRIRHFEDLTDENVIERVNHHVQVNFSYFFLIFFKKFNNLIFKKDVIYTLGPG